MKGKKDKLHKNYKYKLRKISAFEFQVRINTNKYI